VLTCATLGGGAKAQAVITPAVTVDGPSSSILDFGGVAMAADGTGGVTYVKSVDGTPHVFASRFSGGSWSSPIRVDAGVPYGGSEPRIAAGVKGELLVVWVTQVATVHGKVQYGLYSASLGRGSNGFGREQLVDPDVGDGIGVDPSVSATAPGQAIVAYRAITFNFNPREFSTAVQLRPGDVMADIRLARLKEDRWSRLGAVNRNPEASMRPPTPYNGPQVAAGVDGGAAVAWQEPDQSGAARIWLRRIFGTTPGPILEASPTSWQGAPVTADADAFSLAVTAFSQVRLAFRIAQEAGSALSGRLLLNSLQPNFSTAAATFTGAQLADGGSGGALGPPAVSANDEGGAEGTMRLGFLAGSDLRQVGVDPEGAITGVATPLGPRAQAGAQAVTAVSPVGGSIVAYPALDSSGNSAVAVMQEFRSGAEQTGILYGGQGGPVAELAMGSSILSGDGLIAFRQGEPGHFEIVAERVSTPPALFRIKPPTGWIKPTQAKLRWEVARSTVGGIRYSVLIGGRVVKRNLRKRSFRPRRAQLGNGISQMQVLATDALGGQLMTPAVRLHVDGEPPILSVKARPGSGSVSVSVRDADSGVLGKATLVRFGDGETVRHGSKLHHAYQHAGRYTVFARASDRAGNRVARRFEVRVR
jgi:hypothetical protein